MSTYFVKGKGWRYNFILKGTRYTKAWFDTKRVAKQAEAEKRKELENPNPVSETPIDMAFLDLVNLRLDHVKAYNSESHYTSYLYMGRRWAKLWGDLVCSGIKIPMVQKHLINPTTIVMFTL